MKARQNVKSARSVPPTFAFCFLRRAVLLHFGVRAVLIDLRVGIPIGQVGARRDARAGQERDRCQARVDPDGE